MKRVLSTQNVTIPLYQQHLYLLIWRF